MSERRCRAELVWLLGLCLATAAVYHELPAHPFVEYDDVLYILKNPQVVDFGRDFWAQLFTPKVGYVVPVTVAVEAALLRAGGGDPGWFHLTSLLLHLLNVCQVWWFARRMGAAPPAAGWATGVFALHPLCVEPVAWAVGLKDLLAVGGVLFASRLLWREWSERGTTRTRVAAGVLVALAMLCKPVAAAAPFGWLLALCVERLRARPVPASALCVSGLSAVAGLIVTTFSAIAHNILIAAPAWDPRAPWAALGAQLWHLLWPVRLHPAYPNPSDNLAFLTLGVLGAALSVWLLLLASRRASTTFALFTALALYAPVSNWLPFERMLADSYLYGPLALGAVALAQVTPKWPARARPWMVALGLLLLSALAWRSGVQLRRFRGGAALWRPTVGDHPDFRSAYRNLGGEHLFRRELPQAAGAYRELLALEWEPGAALNYANVLERLGRTGDSECVLAHLLLEREYKTLAAYNYLLGLSRHPRTPRYPGWARRALDAYSESLRRPGSQQNHVPPADFWTPLKAQLAGVSPAEGPPPACDAMR